MTNIPRMLGAGTKLAISSAAAEWRKSTLGMTRDFLAP